MEFSVKQAMKIIIVLCCAIGVVSVSQNITRNNNNKTEDEVNKVWKTGQGKNLFDGETWYNMGYKQFYSTYLEYSDGVYTLLNKNESNGYVTLKKFSIFNIDAPFTLSAEITDDKGQFIIVEQDAEGNWKRQYRITKKTKNVTITPDDRIVDYFIMISTTQPNSTFEVKNIQIEKGSTATDYEQYNPPILK